MTTLANLEDQRDALISRMEEIERVLNRIELPGAMDRRELETLKRQMNVQSRGEVRGRLRTEHLRIRNHLQYLTYLKERSTKGPAISHLEQLKGG